MDTWLNTDRDEQVALIKQQEQWDMLVIGGGITGAGIAREAARQGKKVLLIEQKDFAWGTSSRSSKMVHGGLRYLASGNLKLTSHSVKERERLMNEAPGLVDLMTYSWIHYKGGFPGPFVFNTLLSIYDKFAGRRYRQYMERDQAIYDLPYINTDGLIGSTRFADAVTDDSRLVMRVLREAARDGAFILNYCEAQELIKPDSNSARVTGVLAKDDLTGENIALNAKVVVSATGAWADKFRTKLGAEPKIRPLRGSHLVVPSWRLSVAQSIALHHPEDGRAMFVFPWEGMTVIGTTDLDNPEADKTEPRIAQDEVEYLLKAANSLFPSVNLTESDVVSTFAGVRPIVSSGALNPSAEKRDHTIWDDEGLVTVSGGKLTTFRLIALDVLKAASKYLPDLDWKDHGKSIFQPSEVPSNVEHLTRPCQRRLLGFYGKDLSLLAQCAKEGDWELVPGTQTYWAQVRFAAQTENVRHLDDLLLRRTRLGLFLPKGAEAEKDRIQTICREELGWDENQWQQEWHRYIGLWREAYSLPSVKKTESNNNNNEQEVEVTSHMSVA